MDDACQGQLDHARFRARIIRRWSEEGESEKRGGVGHSVWLGPSCSVWVVQWLTVGECVTC